MFGINQGGPSECASCSARLTLDPKNLGQASILTEVPEYVLHLQHSGGASLAFTQTGLWQKSWPDFGFSCVLKWNEREKTKMWAFWTEAFQLVRHPLTHLCGQLRSWNSPPLPASPDGEKNIMFDWKLRREVWFLSVWTLDHRLFDLRSRDKWEL